MEVERERGEAPPYPWLLGLVGLFCGQKGVSFLDGLHY